MNKIKLYQVILVFSFLIVSQSCNTEKHYKTLSIFFDGVPQQQIPDTTSIIETRTLRQANETSLTKGTADDSPYGSVHPDYQDKECGNCHEASFSNELSEQQPEMCYQCHDDFSDKFQSLHGPVAAGFCTTCHFPHKSDHEALLVMPIKELCQHCHVPGDVNKNEAHKEISQVSCINCHDPHGGATASLLKG